MKRIYWDSKEKSNGPFKWMSTVRYVPKRIREEKAKDKEHGKKWRREHPHDYCTPIPKRQKRMVPLHKSVKPAMFDLDKEKEEKRYFVCPQCYDRIDAKNTSLGCPLWVNTGGGTWGKPFG